MQNPRRNIPKAARRFFARLVVFYIGGVLAIGVICRKLFINILCQITTSCSSDLLTIPQHKILADRSLAFNDARLTNGGVGAKSSAFVAGISNAGIKGLGSVVNAVIITSAWSSGNSFLYMSSRSLYSLAVAGNAPAIFKRCNRWGVPWPAVLASSLFCPLAYLNCANSGSTVFTWFVNLTNTSAFISWICCCIVYLR